MLIYSVSVMVNVLILIKNGLLKMLCREPVYAICTTPLIPKIDVDAS